MTQDKYKILYDLTQAGWKMLKQYAGNSVLTRREFHGRLVIDFDKNYFIVRGQFRGSSTQIENSLSSYLYDRISHYNFNT